MTINLKGKTIIIRLTNQAEEENKGENDLNGSTILHMILGPLKQSVYGTIPTIQLLLIIITSIKATFIPFADRIDILQKGV